MNTAFVFVKPHAVTPAVEEVVLAHLKKELGDSSGADGRGLIVAEGSISAHDIGDRGLVDKHYGVLAARAMSLKPADIPTPPKQALAAFEREFGASWKSAVDSGQVLNAAEATALWPNTLRDPRELERRWRSGPAVKLFPGTYAARMSGGNTGDDNDSSRIVVNGFYPSMRAKFADPAQAPHGIRYFVVSWPEARCSWRKFREDIIGATDPTKASPSSIRGDLLARWQDLGLAAAPAGADNGVHASASPVEGLYERRTWLGETWCADYDPFWRQLGSAGLADVRSAWCGSSAAQARMSGGENPLVFDEVELMDTSACLKLMTEEQGKLKSPPSTTSFRQSSLGLFSVLSDEFILGELFDPDVIGVGLGETGRDIDVRNEKRRQRGAIPMPTSERSLAEDIPALKMLTNLMLTSRYWYVLATEESLWKTIVCCMFVRRKRAHYVFKGSWRRTALLGYTHSDRQQFDAALEPQWDHKLDERPERLAREQQLLARADARPLHRLQVHGVNNSDLYWKHYRAHVDPNTWAVLPDDATRVDVVPKLSGQEFRERFARKNVPAVIQGLSDGWPALENWTRGVMLAKYGNRWFKTNGVDEDGHSFRMRLRDFFCYSARHHDEKPIYLFDNKFSEHTAAMLSDYKTPEYFREDFFAWLTEKDRPDWRWFLIGPARSGSPLHQDPHNTSAWNTILSGRKRWIFYPPDVIPPAVDPKLIDSEYYAAPDTVKWFAHTYPTLADPKWKGVKRPLEIVQEAGDTVFVPSGWWHSVLNLEETVAITQNAVDEDNFEKCWGDLVEKGREQNSLRRAFKAAILRERPSLLHGVHVPDEEKFDGSSSDSDSSSDESSSSSSSYGDDTSSSSSESSSDMSDV